MIIFCIFGCEKTQRDVKTMEDTGYVIYADQIVNQTLEYNILLKHWMPTTNINYKSKIHFNSLGIDYEDNTISMYNTCKNLQNTKIKISYQLITHKSAKTSLTKRTDVNIISLSRLNLDKN